MQPQKKPSFIDKLMTKVFQNWIVVLIVIGAFTLIGVVVSKGDTSTQTPIRATSPTIKPIEAYQSYAVAVAHATVYSAPNGSLMGTTDSPGVIFLEHRTNDAVWYERAGGGWLRYDTVIVCSNEEAALAKVQELQPSFSSASNNNPPVNEPPTATPLPVRVPPTVTPRPAPTPVPVSSGVTFLSVTGASPGGTAFVNVQTAPGANCDITYFTPAGTNSTAKGLFPKNADAGGRVSCSWTIGTNTRPGTGSVIVTCNGASGRSAITIS